MGYEYTPIDGAGSTAPTPRRRNWTTFLLALYSIWATVAVIALAVFNQRLSRNVETRQSPLLSDFKTSLRYTIEKPPANAWEDQTYSGKPSAQVELAWTDLLMHRSKHGYRVKISTAEADELGFEDYVADADGRVLSAPTVFHGLHCLRRVRQILYADQYYPNMTQEQYESNRHHIVHCLETIRSSMVCNPDLTLLRVEHIGGKDPFKAMPAPLQKCVDWQSLVEVVNLRMT